MIQLFYTLNLLLLSSCLLAFRLKTNERLLSLSIVQTLLFLPLLAWQYLYLYYTRPSQALPLLFFSETLFGIVWFCLAHRMRRSTLTTVQESRFFMPIQIAIGSALFVLTSYYLTIHPLALISENLVFNLYDKIYFGAFFLLTCMLYSAWRLEEFWRVLEQGRRWEYKFLIIGCYLVCGTFVWASSYRLTYQCLPVSHFTLLAALMLMAWFLILYAVIRHRLLNRKMFISRKVVYSFVAPSFFAIYLCILGIISIIINRFGLSLPFVLRWFFLTIGIIGLGLFLCSAKLRRRVQFFISTHFYVNKYEYRDEWLALSHKLQGALTEAEVVAALQEVLAESLYTNNILIWLGDMERGYKPVSLNSNQENKPITTLSGDDSLILFLKEHPYFYLRERKTDNAQAAVEKKMTTLYLDFNLVLMAPLFIGDQLVGLIGLGSEFTGGRYGHDDFDLLTALGTQTASALLAVRMAEKLAHLRERQAWDKLSAFVLHDVKNAATMLSLIRENAPDHIQNPEFQQDMLEAVDDALVRIEKVQKRLSMLKGDAAPIFQNLEFGSFFNERCLKICAKLGRMQVESNFTTKIWLQTDPELLERIMENLLLNAFEAGGDRTTIRINIYKDEAQREAVIDISDNGPGIAEDLLPNALFDPFKTSRPQGTGIGLWHVQQLVSSLKGSISAGNSENGGAIFVIKLPLSGE